MPEIKAQLEQAAHLGLGIGRLMFLNGAEASHVRDAVTRVIAAFGYECRLIVTYEALLLTVASGEEFRTKVGYRIPAINVNMAAVGAINRLIDDLEQGRQTPAQAQATMDAIPHAPPIWNRWVVVLGIGLTAGSLARLFGGDWGSFFVAWLAGSAGMIVRQEMGRRGFNIFLIPFIAALVSGIVGGLGVLLNLTASPALCLLAPGMVIVPGVPLVNAVEEMIKNHITLGMARLALGTIITIAIALGLYTASRVTGIEIPVVAASQAISVPEDALFSALAAIGFLFLFNVPGHLAWASVLCGLASHSLRTVCVGFGMNIVTGTFIGALVVGFLAQTFARRFQAPAVAFGFPGVVAMVPGAFAFRAFAGSMLIVQSGAGTDTPIVIETLSLATTCVLMVAAIAIGLAIPLILKRTEETPGRSK